MADKTSYCAQMLRRQDADRYLTALFAPADRREALFALYAFNVEIARAREAVSEPFMGLIRLQWWRDALADIYRGGQAGIRAHEVVRPLAQAIQQYRLPPELFERLIATRERDLDSDPPADLAALVDYADGSSAALVMLALDILGEPTQAAREAGRATGIAWALTGLLRAVPFHASRRRLYLPASLMAEAGLVPQALFERGPSAALVPVVRAVAGEASLWLVRARESAGQVPRRFQPALLSATLATAYLRRLAAAKFNPFDERVQQTPPWRIWSLACRRLLGGY
jgi:NADH dehydrogenase [ubiquinone] 1 alpha subcomplex assembly factor 6